MKNFRRGRHDDGLALVLMALTLVVLMIFAAFAVDLGAVYNERRLDQNGVDAAAMSGGVIAMKTGDIQDAVDEVLAKVVSEVDSSITTADWTSCNDPDSLARTAATLASVTPDTDCISWSSDFEEMRVRLPDQVVNTSFARVIGINSLTTRAFAHIEFEPMNEGGAALPFVVLASAGAGDHICIRTSSAGNPPTMMSGNGPNVPATVGAAPAYADPCDDAVYDPASSTFGSILPRDYEGGCDQQNENVRLAIIDGYDHPTGFFGDPDDNNPPPFTIPPGLTASQAQTLRQSTYADVRIDGPGPQCTTFMPNTLALNTGLSNSDLRCAFISPSNSNVCENRTARLQQGSNVSSSNIFTGERLDNVAPWAYFTSNSNLPTSCTTLRSNVNSSSWDFYDKREEFIDCLNDFNPNTHDELFTDAIGNSPRFGYVPQIAEARLCEQQTGSQCNSLSFIHVNSYAPIFINKLYAKQGNNQLGCEVLDPRLHSWYMHEAGQVYPAGNCGPTNSALDRASAFVLDCRMLPKTVCDPELVPGVPGNPGGTVSIVNLRLSR